MSTCIESQMKAATIRIGCGAHGYTHGHEHSHTHIHAHTRTHTHTYIPFEPGTIWIINILCVKDSGKVLLGRQVLEPVGRAGTWSEESL